MAKARWGVEVVIAGLLVLGFAAPAPAQQTSDKFSEAYKSRPEDVEAVLRYQPRQDGIDYSKPTPEEVKACTMKLIDGGANKTGWLLFDPQGRPLRRFYDSTGKKRADGKTHSDTWSYYKDGVEVYREIDTDLNDKPDQFRWLNSAGTKWGVDLNEDGKIDVWRIISAEEVAQEYYQAVLARDFARLKALFINEEEIRTLKVPTSETTRLRDGQAKAQAKFQDLCAKSAALMTKATFIRVEGAVPQCLPADPLKGLGQDLLRYPTRGILYETAEKKVEWLNTGEIIQVGQAWRLVDVWTEDTAPKVNVALEKLMKELNELDKKQPPWDGIPGKNQKVVDYNVTRVALVEQILKLADAKDKEAHLRQILDNLCTAHQNNGGEDKSMLLRLGQYKNQIVQSAPSSNLAGYAHYREIWARFAFDLMKSKDPGKTQKEWSDELVKFVTAYPKAEDTPDALSQLAMNCEFAGKDKQDEAKKYYGLIATNFQGHPLAPKAAGAVKRLELNGKTMQLTGPTLQGAQFDLAKLSGKVTVVYYWASHCRPCVGDFAVMKNLQATYGAKGLEIVSVSLDETAEDAKKFLTANPLPGTHLFQATATAKGLESPLAVQYGIVGLPTIILIGKDGRVIDRAIQVSDLEDAIKKAQ